MSGSENTNEVGGDEYTPVAGSAFSKNAPKPFISCQRKERSVPSKRKEIGKTDQRGKEIQDVCRDP